MSPSTDESLRLRHLVELYSQQRRWADVKKYAYDWLALDPEAPAAHYSASWAALHLNEIAVASRHAICFRQLCPDSSLAHRLDAEVLCKQSRFLEAVPLALAAVAAEPSDADNYALLARVQTGCLQFEEAFLSIQAALRLDPQCAKLQALYATIKQLAAQKRTAANAVQEISDLKLALAESPQSVWILHRLGQLYTNFHDFATSSDFFRQALVIDPSNQKMQRALLETTLAQSLVFQILDAPTQRVCTTMQISRHWRLTTTAIGRYYLIGEAICFGIPAMVILPWSWLPALIYRQLNFAELWRYEAEPYWLRAAYNQIAAVPRAVRGVAAISATLAIWTAALWLLGVHVVGGLFTLAVILSLIAMHVVTVRFRGRRAYHNAVKQQQVLKQPILAEVVRVLDAEVL